MSDRVPEADSLLPYARWAEDAMRAVVVEAVAHVAQHGLPGEHHFYVTFRTDYPGVAIPAHLKARFPQEMTIVLQHRFWDLKMDRAAGTISVGLSFGGVPATLVVPLASVTAFVDPHVRFGLQFSVGEALSEDLAAPEAEDGAGAGREAAVAEPQVVSLEAFRRRPKRD